MDSGMENFPGIERMTSSLSEAKNDTGRTAFCGPYVLSAITGYPISKIEDIIRTDRNCLRKTVVKGTGADEVAAALAQFGYEMTLKETHMAKARKERPTLWTWMQKPRNVWAHYILAVHKGSRCVTPTPRGAGPSCATARIAVRASWKSSKSASRSPKSRFRLSRTYKASGRAGAFRTGAPSAPGEHLARA